MTITQAHPRTAEDYFGAWLTSFAHAVESGDAAAFADSFSADGYWKDILSFTGGFRTFAGPASIQEAWSQQFAQAAPTNVRVSSHNTAPRLVRRSARDIVEGYFEFETAQGHGVGFVRLLRTEDHVPKAWILLTTLHSIVGHEEKIGERRPTGVQYSQNFAGDNWLDQRVKEQQYADRDPEVLIIGGGQGGLILGARLRQMGVDALIIEKTPKVGDNWRNRYHSLTLHNEVWANSLPYMPFPETWPTFVPKDKLAGWLEAYAEAMELNVWTSSEMLNAAFDEATKTWTVVVRRGDEPARTMQVSHVVMAVGGVTGVPSMPALAGLDGFEGDVIHSSLFGSGIPYAGKHAIVIGTGTSGHDVAQDLYENGAASVTMVQRGPTCVVSLVPSGTMVYSLYSEGPPPADIDLITAAIPYDVLRETYQFMTKKTCELDRELLDGLRDAGFKLSFGDDDTGFHMMYLRDGGGYYINVGCSELISDRKIGLVQSEDLNHFTANGLVLGDGTELPADLVVMATGFSNLKDGVATMFGGEVAERVGPIWGFDENNAMRNMWQRTPQPGFWVMGGSLIDARLYSRFLAVAIVSDLAGIELPSA